MPRPGASTPAEAQRQARACALARGPDDGRMAPFISRRRARGRAERAATTRRPPELLDGGPSPAVDLPTTEMSFREITRLAARIFEAAGRAADALAHLAAFQRLDSEAQQLTATDSVAADGRAVRLRQPEPARSRQLKQGQLQRDVQLERQRGAVPHHPADGLARRGRRSCFALLLDRLLLAPPQPQPGARRQHRPVGGQRRAGKGAEGQDRVPGDDQPRDPHAAERHPRHDPGAARRPPGRAPTCASGSRSCTAPARRCRRWSTTSSTSPRWRHGGLTLVERADRRRRDPARRRAAVARPGARRKGLTLTRRHRRGCRARSLTDGGAPAPDRVQPAVQRDQVHAARARSTLRARSAATTRAPRRWSSASRDTGIGIARRPAREHLRGVPPGRWRHHAPVRRHRAGPGDLPQPGARAGRRHRRSTSAPGEGSTFTVACRSRRGRRRGRGAPATRRRGLAAAAVLRRRARSGRCRDAAHAARRSRSRRSTAAPATAPRRWHRRRRRSTTSLVDASVAAERGAEALRRLVAARAAPRQRGVHAVGARRQTRASAIAELMTVGADPDRRQADRRRRDLMDALSRACGATIRPSFRRADPRQPGQRRNRMFTSPAHARCVTRNVASCKCCSSRTMR